MRFAARACKRLSDEGVKLTNTMARNAKSNAQKEGSSSKPTNAAKTAPVTAPTTTKAPARKQAACQTESSAKSAKPKSRIREMGFLFRICHYLLFMVCFMIFAIWGAATVLILMDCYNGAHDDIPGNIALCGDLRRLSRFEEPHPHFIGKASNSYYYVIMSHYRQFRANTFNPYRRKVYKAWDNFKKTEKGGKIAYYLIKIHTFVVENVLAAFFFVDGYTDQLFDWYDNGGYKYLHMALYPLKVALWMAFEVLRDVAIHVYHATVYVSERASEFGQIWFEKGLDAALKFLN